MVGGMASIIAQKMGLQVEREDAALAAEFAAEYALPGMMGLIGAAVLAGADEARTKTRDELKRAQDGYKRAAAGLGDLERFLHVEVEFDERDLARRSRVDEPALLVLAVAQEQTRDETKPKVVNAVTLEVDGEAVDGTIVPLPRDGQTEVHVRARVA